MIRASGLRRVLTMVAVLVASSSALAAEDGVWSVGKSSGEVWITTTGAEQASLKQEDTLKAGDTIQTGRNGRVLLVRGDETILVAPNSVVGLPTEKKDGLSTTILQQAGSILLEVERRNVKHFEVETPYLAAVVKGTQFSVTVNAESTSVDVKRGQVEVSDFKSGQIAQVMPGQAATSFTHGKPGLSLSGAGPFSSVEQGKPRASSIERIPVPKGGLLAPHNVGDGKAIHALNGHASFGKLAKVPTEQRSAAKASVIRLSTALGEVRLNVQKATHGLAHGSVTAGSVRSGSREAGNDTIWSDNKTSVSGANGFAQTASGSTNSASSAVSATSAAGATTTSTSAATAATVAAAATDSGSGNNGGGNSATGNGKSANNGNGNNGNGNGNGGVGNGKGNGNSKH